MDWVINGFIIIYIGDKRIERVNTYNRNKEEKKHKKSQKRKYVAVFLLLYLFISTVITNQCYQWLYHKKVAYAAYAQV